MIGDVIILLTAGSFWAAVAARFFLETGLPDSSAAVIPGETRSTQGSGILVSSPQDPPADLGKAPALLAALPGF
jgi:hypothetical protein